MHGTERSRREDVLHSGGADPTRRRLLLAIVALPLAARGALVGCSRREEGSPEPGAAARPTPAAPQPAAKAPADSGPGSAKAPEAAPPAAPPSGAAAGGQAGDALVTEIDAMKPTVQALGYVIQSPHPDQHCSNCQFYTQKSAERGSCQLFTQGQVASGGWCTSWTKRVGA